jgi:hypothetical protein
MENSDRRQGEFQDMLDWVKRWLADPFDLVVSFLAAFAWSDHKADIEVPVDHKC